MDTGAKVLIGVGIVAAVGLGVYAVSKLSHPTVDVGSGTWGGLFSGIGSIVSAASGTHTSSSGGGTGESGGWATGGKDVLDDSDYSMPDED